jgi:hypothetical protein
MLFQGLAELFSGARFIHIVRDGRDCATSAWFHNGRVNAAERAENFGTLDAYIETFARHWATEVARCWAWREARPLQSRQVRYEDLVDQRDQVLRSLFRFLSVAAGDAQPAACRREAAFEDLTHGGRSGRRIRRRCSGVACRATGAITSPSRTTRSSSRSPALCARGWATPRSAEQRCAVPPVRHEG